MPAQPPKILFDKALLRIRLVFNPLELGMSPYPQQYIIKAKERMEQLKAEKVITDFVVYEKLFNELLNAPEPKRLPAQEGQSDTFEILLAQGFLANGTLKLRLDEVDNNKVIKISISPQKSAQHPMAFEWVEAAVESFLARNGLTHHFDHGALRGLYLSTEKLQADQIGMIPLYPPRHMRDGTPPKTFEIKVHNSDMDLSLVIYSLSPVFTKESRRDLVNEIQLEMQRVDRRTKQMHTLMLEDVKHNFSQILAGPCRFGLSFPVSFLVAKALFPGESGNVPDLSALQPELVGNEQIGSIATQAPAVPQVPKEAGETDPAYPYVDFEIDSDKMIVNIRLFDTVWYEKYKDRIDSAWLKANLKRANIKSSDESLIAGIQKQIEARADLTAMMVAKGTRAERPREPYLELVNSRKDNPEGKIDFRESGSLRLVEKEELVAQIKYKYPGKKGVDVYGKGINIPPGDKLNVRTGENIIEREGGRFIAAEHGVVIFEDGKISVKNSLIINGGVNLATGNIDFKGAVIVEGNIEVGSSVVCDGPLIVKGGIEDAFVKVKSDIKVSEGIAMGKSGRLICGGNLDVAFIQNSNVQVFGDLRVRGAILNCDLQCRGNIQVKFDDGVIGGGVVRCQGSMDVATLGFKNGTKTLISLGAPFGVEASFSLWEKRIRAFDAAYNEAQKQLRELKSRKKIAHQIEKLETSMKNLEARSERLEKDKHFAMAKLQAAKERMIYNQEATLKVRSVIHKTVVLLLGGKENTRLSDVAQSYFTVRPVRGRNIFRLEEAPKQAG